MVLNKAKDGKQREGACRRKKKGRDERGSALGCEVKKGLKAKRK